MWLTSSSVGRKFIMALTGAALVLFVTFHCLMNSVAIFWPSAYNTICGVLGANWYALVATLGLAALVGLHILYALWLTYLNRKARGSQRYAISHAPKTVEWSSRNMLVLGFVVLAFLGVHFVQFWAKMQLVELIADSPADWATSANGTPIPPHAGTLFLQAAFSEWWTPVIYIVGFIALWFHMTHGFWSMFQSVGWANTVWVNRLKCIGNWWTTIVIGLFIVQAVVFSIQANKKFYMTDPTLVKQYEEMLNEAKEEVECCKDLCPEAKQEAMDCISVGEVSTVNTEDNFISDFDNADEINEPAQEGETI